MQEKRDYSRIYSPTKLRLFEKCPKAYHFYYLDPIYSKLKSKLKKEPQNIWSFYTIGKAVHNAITLFYYLPEEQRNLRQLKENLKLTWKSEVFWNKKMPLGKWGGFKTIEEERGAYALSLKMLENFYNFEVLKPEIEYLPTKDFFNSIDDYHNLISPLDDFFDISGKFDLILKNDDGLLHVIDFKTNSKEEEDNFQLKFYKLLAETKFKKKVSKASFYFLRTGHPREFNLEMLRAEEIKEEVVSRVNEIVNTKIFEPKPSKLCKYCLFKNFCPEREKVEEIIKEVEEVDYSDDLPF